MIYNSFIESVNENEMDALLEEARDRFEYNTMAEATATIVAEHEENWVRFMKGIGISELTSVMEGEEVIYEGARLDAFFEKAKQFFEKAKIRLAEITKRFIANVEKFVATNNHFVKKYGDAVKKMTVPSDFEFKGYEFDNMDKPIPYMERMKHSMKSINAAKAKSIIEKRDDYSKEAAERDILGGKGEGSFSERLTKYFYNGEKEKKKLASISPAEQVKILQETKELKSEARKSLNSSIKAINKMIKELKDAQSEHKKGIKDSNAIKSANDITNAYSAVLGYYRAYSACVLMAHGSYIGALSKRNAQAKAICTKLISTTAKADSKEKREKIGKKPETKVNTEAFLGAIEFI